MSPEPTPSRLEHWLTVLGWSMGWLAPFHIPFPPPWHDWPAQEEDDERSS